MAAAHLPENRNVFGAECLLAISRQLCFVATRSVFSSSAAGPSANAIGWAGRFLSGRRRHVLARFGSDGAARDIAVKTIEAEGPSRPCAALERFSF